MGAFSIWHWLLVLLVVVLLFGGSKLRNLGADLGTAIKGFRNSVRDGESEVAAERHAAEPPQAKQQDVASIDAEIKALMDQKARLQTQQGGGRVINSEAAGRGEHKA